MDDYASMMKPRASGSWGPSEGAPVCPKRPASRCATRSVTCSATATVCVPIKDSPVKGANQIFKRGTVISYLIYLTRRRVRKIDCRYPGIKGSLVLRAEFVRKAL